MAYRQVVDTYNSTLECNASVKAKLSDEEIKALDACSKSVQEAGRNAVFAQGGVREILPGSAEYCLYYSGPDKQVDQRRLLLPASEEDIDRLSEVATPSAHGYGGLTVMDPTYRSAKELTVDRFALNFDPLLGILREIQTMYLHDGVHLRAHLYKLNIYPTGGFFKAHQDTPKDYSHIGRLVICLPSKFEGGQLAVKSRDGRNKTFDWSKVCSQGHIGWGFLYSDCTHEVLPVTAGSRLTLAYNVYADKSPEQLLGRTQISETNLYARIRAVAAVNGSKKQLAFGMSHVYPQPNKRHGDRTILPQHLKGVDLLIYNIAKALGLVVETGVILIKPDEPEQTDDEDEDEDRDGDYEDDSQTSDADDKRQQSDEVVAAKPIEEKKYYVSPDVDMGLQGSIIDRYSIKELLSSRTDLIWVTPHGKSFEGGQFIRQGNQASLDYLYVAGVIMITIPETSREDEVVTEFEVPHLLKRPRY